jgi:hypothetical protein
LQKIATATAATVLGVNEKSLDNILCRVASDQLPPGERGRRRLVPVLLIEQIAIALILRRDLDIPLSRGMQLAEALTKGGGSVGHDFGSLTFDLKALRTSLRQTIADAIEQTALPVRGRPRAI